MGLFSRGASSPTGEPARSDGLACVLAYHAASKHDFQRYAHGPGELDWATQPDPFRRYAGAPLVALDHVPPQDEPRYDSALAGELTAAPLARRSLSQLLYDSLALSAWKHYGDARWSLRCNPSSGNLHPTEGYVVCGPVPGLSERAFVAHYAPREHALEMRAELSLDAWQALARGLPDGGCFVGLTSILWRESWKYGERAFRYCQHDVGHALAALAVAAAGLGWRARALDALASAELAQLLGVAGQRGPEAEHADVLVALAPRECAASAAPSSEALAACAGLHFAGLPNDLSPAHVDWDAVEAVELATRKPRTSAPSEPLAAPPRVACAEPSSAPSSLRRVVRGRRSAQAFDARSSMARADFLRVVRRTLPGAGGIVLDVLPSAPLVDLLLFVERVDGLEPGLYLLLRDARREARWRAALRADFAWQPLEDAGAGVVLARLHTGDVRALARSLACHQEIASDGCFAVAMLADFRAPLAQTGAWFYRRLFWECGALGQLLYLEAERLGLRGTGIGCFFDGAVHRALGLASDEFQSLYHFTLGAALEDARISVEAAYPGDGTPAGGAPS